MSRIAVIGSGISGLSAAWHLTQADHAHQITVFEAGSHFGGHANTVDVTLDGVTHGVDTGFLVYNERTYPGLIQLFETLNVACAPSDMSFSVQSPRKGRAQDHLEWSGSSLNTVFAQRRNLLSPRFWSMLKDIVRFNSLTTSLAQRGEDVALRQPIGEFLDQHQFSEAFKEDYFLPMVACIWSCPTEQMLRFPMATMIRFCHNHGLLQVANRPQWFTVKGGSREYVRKVLQHLPDTRLNTPVTSLTRLSDEVIVHTPNGNERFDGVVLACHSDQALRLLGHQASPQESRLLGAIRYQPNRAVLHTDETLLPKRRMAWAAWNYERAVNSGSHDAPVCLHYLINRLQPLPWQRSVIVSLNPLREPRTDQVIQTIEYDHPVFDQAAIDAQRTLHTIQGLQRTWYAGAWCGYGFHEDGFQAGLRAAQDLNATLQAAVRQAA
ncbi:MAG: NAD(P)/FAD-dependent oxidoreductase [Aquabacterium sp.]|uniref:NAD(P)/FAD-dependent oxidoreductase n=1 Tax=Aquabacterium sp. TaxID=1872578 RepID=UPI003BECDDB8